MFQSVFLSRNLDRRCSLYQLKLGVQSIFTSDPCNYFFSQVFLVVWRAGTLTDIFETRIFLLPLWIVFNGKEGRKTKFTLSDRAHEVSRLERKMSDLLTSNQGITPELAPFANRLLTAALQKGNVRLDNAITSELSKFGLNIIDSQQRLSRRVPAGASQLDRLRAGAELLEAVSAGGELGGLSFYPPQQAASPVLASQRYAGSKRPGTRAYSINGGTKRLRTAY